MTRPINNFELTQYIANNPRLKEVVDKNPIEFKNYLAQHLTPNGKYIPAPEHLEQLKLHQPTFYKDLTTAQDCFRDNWIRFSAEGWVNAHAMTTPPNIDVSMSEFPLKELGFSDLPEKFLEFVTDNIISLQNLILAGELFVFTIIYLILIELFMKFYNAYKDKIRKNKLKNEKFK
jgi:hypothetical protein